MQMVMTLIGKSILLCLALLGRKGTALPGLVIERLYPRYLNSMLNKLPRSVIVITGTNGKTTTTKVVTELLRASGLRVLTNPTGSNFVRGIIAAIAKHATVFGGLPYDIAVFEQDEAHAVHFVKRYQPVGVVALNVMRDQMDRFGEIDTTAKLIGKVVASARDWVVLNANDKRVAALADVRKYQSVHWFGHSKELQKLFVDDDQLYATKPVFFEAEHPDVLLEAVRPGEIELGLQRWHKSYKVPIALSGTHNAINVAAALATMLATVREYDVDIDHAVSLMSKIRPAFGRGERILLPTGIELQLQLVKNPAGFRHALNVLSGERFAAIGIAINDDYADGRDVSWLWDVDFSMLPKQDATIVTGGTRAADMAVRLKYDGVKTSAIEPELERFLQQICEQAQGAAIIFCTYTAMLSLRKLLKRYDKQLHKEGL